MSKYQTITQPDFTMDEMAAFIDHSLLTPFVSKKDLDAFLQDVIKYKFKACAINNSNTEYCANKLAGSSTIVAPAVAFPFGVLAPDVKAAEVASAIKMGAGEIDIVSNIGAAKSGDWELYYRDCAACAEVAHKAGLIIKVIIETCYLTKEEKIKCCEVAKKAGMDFVKTSTGFGVSGFTSTATLGDVKLMKSVVGMDMGVKASGPIGDYDTAVAMINAGAHRIGSRNGVSILMGCTDYKA